MTTALLAPPTQTVADPPDRLDPVDDGTRREFIAGGIALSLGLAACGDEDSGFDGAATRRVRHARGVTDVPTDPKRASSRSARRSRRGSSRRSGSPRPQPPQRRSTIRPPTSGSPTHRLPSASTASSASATARSTSRGWPACEPTSSSPASSMRTASWISWRVSPRRSVLPEALTMTKPDARYFPV